MLQCADCGTRLTGDTGYYRDRDVCALFIDTRPTRRGRGRTYGHAYRQELYGHIVEALLAEASIGPRAGA